MMQSILTNRRGWLLAASALMAANALYAQQGAGYSATGVLCDSLTREPLPFATIRLLQETPQRKAVRVAATTADGRFTIAPPQAGIYTLEAFVTGMEPLRRQLTFTAAHRTVTCDTLYIKEYSNTLSSATITAEKPLVKAELDKITYSISDDPDAQTSSVLDMLRKVPMVTVDGEDNIQVNGSSSFKVYVNGKPNQMMSQNPSLIFKTYPASAIKKIEVITNPGAKYDAEGTAGVLNIITDAEAKTKGYVLTPDLHYANHNSYGGNVFAMTQFGKLTMSLNYGVGRNVSPRSTQGSSREVFGDADNHLLTSESEYEGKGIYQFGNLDASYEISSKDLLSVSAGLFSWKGDNDSQGYTLMQQADGALRYRYDQRVHTENRYMGVNASADWQHSFKENQNLTFSYRFNISPQGTKSERFYSNMQQVPDGLGLNDFRNDPDQLSEEHTLQTDFTTPFGETHTLSAGLKYVYRINRSNSREWGRDAGTSNDFVLNEERSLRYRHRSDIGAAYAEYNFKKDKWSLMAGSRYEYYHVRVGYPDGKRSPFSTEISDWVPSVSAGYSIKPTMMVKTGYNMRISRPSISYLSPYENHGSPESVSYGNPDMGSSREHNLNLTYSTFSAKFTLNATLTYSFSNNGMVGYSFMKDGILNSTYGNFLHSKRTSFSAYMNWTIVPGTVFNCNLSGTYGDYKSVQTRDHNSGFSANLWGGLRQDLPWKLKLSLWGGGNTGYVDLQGKGNSNYFYSVTLSRSFLAEDRLTLSAFAGNFIGRYQNFGNTVTTEQFRSESNTRYDALRFGMSVRFRLGSLKAEVKKAARTISNDDVSSGASSGAAAAAAGQQGGGM